MDYFVLKNGFKKWIFCCIFKMWFDRGRVSFLARKKSEKAKHPKICLSFVNSMPEAQIQQCPLIPSPMNNSLLHVSTVFTFQYSLLHFSTAYYISVQLLHFSTVYYISVKCSVIVYKALWSTESPHKVEIRHTFHHDNAK